MVRVRGVIAVTQSLGDTALGEVVLPGSRHVFRCWRPAVFIATDCPARVTASIVNGGPAGRRTRSAVPTIDPVATHEGSATAGKTDKTMCGQLGYQLDLLEL